MGTSMAIAMMTMTMLAGRESTQTSSKSNKQAVAIHHTSTNQSIISLHIARSLSRTYRGRQPCKAR